MRYTIEARGKYLRGEMVERETPEERREFSLAVHAAMVEKGLPRVLVVVRASRPIFRVEEFQLSRLLTLIGAIAGLRAALVSDSKELAAAHEYMQLIATQRGLAVRAFSSEKQALEWLLKD